MSIVLVLTCVYLSEAMAEFGSKKLPPERLNKEVEVRRLTFADPEYEKQSNVSDPQQAGAKAWIAGTKDFPTVCEFISPAQERRSIKDTKSFKGGSPEIFRMPTEKCATGESAKEPFVPYCWGRVSCENPNVRMVIHDVFCKAATAKTCPSARDCALASDLKRGAAEGITGRKGTKQSAYLTTHVGGWGPEKKQDFLWSPEEEADLHKNDEPYDIPELRSGP